MQFKESVYSKSYAYDVLLKTLEEYIKKEGNVVLRVSTIILMLKEGEKFGRSSV